MAIPQTPEKHTYERGLQGYCLRNRNEIEGLVSRQLHMMEVFPHPVGQHS